MSFEPTALLICFICICRTSGCCKVVLLYWLLEMTDSPKPIVLLLGEVLHAKKEWDGLAEIAELRVSFLQLFAFAY